MRRIFYFIFKFKKIYILLFYFVSFYMFYVAFSVIFIVFPAERVSLKVYIVHISVYQIC